MSTMDTLRDRLLAEYGVVTSELPEVTTTAMTDVDPDDVPVRRGRPVKPPLRQPLAETSQKVTRSDSWWMTIPDRSGFTARAEQERARMANDPIGRKAPDQIEGKYITQTSRGMV